ncbi:MAG: ROK family transcriptional regulator [Anaerolineales bacterium]|nr:ROK family transcriptional regulator [Anaerolineales bacterium]
MTQRNSVDHAAMRDMNLALILNTLRVESPLSRVALANITGLNKATVSSMVKELIQNNLVREIGADVSSSDVGRPAINLEPDPEAGYIIGLEIGVDFISIVTVNFAIEVVARRFESTARYFNQEAILDRVLFLLQESYEQVQKWQRPLFGIGIGVPGLVDVASGTLLFAPNLNWRDLPLRDMIRSKINAPVYLANEANLAALGESYFGAGQESDYLLYVSSGVGLGGGIVLNGRLIEGASGFAGEVGHMTVERDGLECNCGNKGCWETVAGQRALFRRITDALQQGQPSWMAQMIESDPSRMSIPLILEAARKEDAVALKALTETGEWLGIGIASLMNVINPQRVIFGGPLWAVHPYLLPSIRETVAQRAWHWVQNGVQIIPAAYGEDAAVMGAVAIVYRDVLNKPRRWLE